MSTIRGSVRTATSVLAALLVSFLLTACTGEDEAPTKDAGQRLEAAAAALATAEALDISLTTKELPQGQQGLLSAKGTGNHTPAFTGDVEVVTGGVTIGAEVIATEGKVWAKTGLSPGFLELDPATLGAPDPAALVGTSADTGLGGLLGATEGVKTGGRSRDGSEVLTEITGTIPGATIAALLPTADDSADFDVTYRLTDDDVLHDAQLTGSFYGADAGAVTYTLTLAPLAEPVTIKAP